MNVLTNERADSNEVSKTQEINQGYPAISMTKDVNVDNIEGDQ